MIGSRYCRFQEYFKKSNSIGPNRMESWELMYIDASIERRNSKEDIDLNALLR